ncbi:MAG: metallophosphoesterase family protein [Phycisphaerales bacterium]
MHDTPISRRDMVKFTGAALAALGAGGMTGRAHAAAPSRPAAARARVMRLAHLTDFHIQPERRAAEGAAACLRHVQSEHKPDLIFTGGDLIMDGFAADEARTKLQWELLVKTLKDECSTPIAHCLGNHDIWGWHKGESKTSGNEPLWGKKWATDQLALDRPYHALDRAGWRLFALDSVRPDPLDANGYIGALDDEQFDWLTRELAATPKTTPVLLVSHIPILTATVVLGGPNKETGLRQVTSGLLHADSPKLRELFAKHPNVKLCLSGHMHRIDRVDFRGVTYLCNGAVSGNWWKGRHHECDEGYAVIDLFDDGSFEHRYVTYGWKAEA